jgi:hypothetical protein
MYSPSTYIARGVGAAFLRVVYLFSRRWSSRRDWSLLRKPMMGRLLYEGNSFPVFLGCEEILSRLRKSLVKAKIACSRG